MIDKYVDKKIVTPTVLFLFIWVTVGMIAVNIVVYLNFDIVALTRHLNSIYFCVVVILLFDTFRKPLNKKSGGHV